jgi:hypothetical protein
MSVLLLFRRTWRVTLQMRFFSRMFDTVYSIVRLIEIDGQLCASVYDVKAVIIH